MGRYDINNKIGREMQNFGLSTQKKEKICDALTLKSKSLFVCEDKTFFRSTSRLLLWGRIIITQKGQKIPQHNNNKIKVVNTKVPTFGGVIYTKYPLGTFNGTKKIMASPNPKSSV